MNESGKTNLNVLNTMFGISSKAGKIYMRSLGYQYKPWIRSNKAGRNSLCSCGSGKKTKNCCGVQCEYNIKN